MALIQDPEAALRLARAIVSGIRRYQGAKLAAGGDVGAAVQEGRELFNSRVAPGLAFVFERSLVDGELSAYAGSVEPSATVTSPTPTASRFADEPSPGPDSRDADVRMLLGLLVGVVLVAAAAGAYFFLQRSTTQSNEQRLGTLSAAGLSHVAWRVPARRQPCSTRRYVRGCDSLPPSITTQETTTPRRTGRVCEIRTLEWLNTVRS